VCSAANEIPRFSAPWTVEEHDFCFIVRDSNYQALAYIYFGDDPVWRVTARLLTRAQARRLASCIASHYTQVDLLSFEAKNVSRSIRPASHWEVRRLQSS
jgi:hypothetical protein